MSSRPVPRGRTSLVLIAGLALLAAILLVVFFIRLSDQPGAKVNIGSNVFVVGKASNFAPAIAKDGPLLFQALRGNQLDIFVQHLGSDPTTGWSAFEAHAPNEGRTCLLRWRQASRDFADPCSARIFPADGAGLNQYPVTVNQKGQVSVDLRQSLGTVPPSSSSAGSG